MRRVFFIEKLVEPAFSQRLRLFLNEARIELNLHALALVELAAADGVLAPRWRTWSPRPKAPPPMTLAQFKRLAQGPRLRALDGSDLSSLQEEFSDSWATLASLSIVPNIASGPDTLLVALHGSDPIAADAWDELQACLIHGLSAERRSRLADVVFQAVEQAADPMELTDREARLFYANRAWQETFGYPVRESLGSTVGRLFRDPIAPIHDMAFYQFTLATLAGGRSWSGALACRAQDGHRVFCEPMVSPFEASDQGFVGNFAVRRNLSHRMERDQALAIAHQEFRAVLSAIPDGVVVLRENKLYFVNAAFLGMVRQTEENVIGRTYLSFIHFDDRARFAEEYENGPTRVRMLREDRSIRFVEISTAGAISFEGEPATIFLSRDITDYRIAQEQLARAEKLSALGALAAGIAHEINNPLAYVSLNLHYVYDGGGLAPQYLESLAEAIDGAERIQRIVAELSAYSCTDSPGPPEPVDVTKAATSAINIAQNEIRHRARLEREHVTNLYVRARESQVVQVLVNLLVNAAQAIPPADSDRHVISVRSFPQGEMVAIHVSDTGIGISETALPYVFDAFSTSKGKGSGLGLAISRRIVKEFGGHIEIRSVLGKGTEVIVLLPAAQEPAPPTGLHLDPTNAPASDRDPGSKALRILIVDDEPAVSRSITRMLPEHDTFVVDKARAALQLFASGQTFDVILCDLMMPDMAGPEFFEEVCRSHAQLRARIVFMTGGAFAGSAQTFLDARRCPQLFKPFTMSKLRLAVQQIVHGEGDR